MAQGLKKRYSIKLLSSVINGVVGAILVAIVPKALSPIAYGQFIYLQDFFAKIIGFLDMGSSIAFFTKLSSNNSRKELIGFYFLYSFSILVLVLLFISILDRLGYLELFIPNIPAYYIYFGLFFGFFTWFIQIFIKISDAFALTLSVESIKVVHKLLSLLFLFYFVYYTNFNLERYFYTDAGGTDKVLPCDELYPYGEIIDAEDDESKHWEWCIKEIVTKEDYYQMQRYLKCANLKLGIIINFRDTYLKPKRIINNEYDKVNQVFVSFVFVCRLVSV
jgi:hypothetical protein